ncbi:MAG: ABC transporter ATP-binding protein [Sulfuricaulis sp.]
MPEYLNGIIVSATNISKRVDTAEGALDILSGVSLEIKTGERVAIIGISGSGKSTLLGLLAGLDSPTQGEITLAGERLNHLDEDGRARVRAGRVGFVFQSFQLLPGLTALENVMLPLEIAGFTEPKRHARELLARVGLDKRLTHYPRQLSGGEQQRVAIARAFVMNPAVLFADEPTGNLDSTSGARVIELLFDLNQEHRTTLVLVTHDENLAAHCERHIYLDAGHIVEHH